MLPATRSIRSLSLLTFLPATVCLVGVAYAGDAVPRPAAYWQITDVRPGMKGQGRTVMKGTKVETFQAEVLGILHNTSPGRDLILCRLSGLDLEKTGVIAGMSGSPVYVEGKLLGAVAYAWSGGTEPIAGITPYSQMVAFVNSHEKRERAAEARPRRVGLGRPVQVGGRDFHAVTVSQGFEEPKPGPADGLWLHPLRTPLAASGFSERSLRLLGEWGPAHGLLPMQGGAVTAKVAEENKDAPLEPGGPLAVALITGDFDLSGIGTVTHIDGERVYGWGHPFMSLGDCAFPLMTGYIHTVYPRRTVSFKMGSPLRAVGVIHADVSTCIAGRLGEVPDLLPVRMRVALDEKEEYRTFQVRVARQPSMLSNLVYTALVNSVDMGGDLPEELTAHFKARIELEGHDPLVIEDTFSETSGRRAPQSMYGEVARAVATLTYNPCEPVTIKRIDCETRLSDGRQSADIEAVELDSDTYAPGDTVRATVFVRPHKKARQRVHADLRLPADLPEGRYVLTVCSDPTCTHLDLRDDPEMDSPSSVAKVLKGLRRRVAARQTRLALRLPVGDTGIALDGKALPDLPPSMVHILGNGRRTGSRAVRKAVVSRTDTDWVLSGTDAVPITVSKLPRYRR